jgi:hypothetical protein
MNRAIQELVNAQIEVIRAVFDANERAVGNENYLLRCIANAQEQLAAASKILLGIKRVPSKKRK